MLLVKSKTSRFFRKLAKARKSSFFEKAAAEIYSAVWARVWTIRPSLVRWITTRPSLPPTMKNSPLALKVEHSVNPSHQGRLLWRV